MKPVLLKYRPKMVLNVCIFLFAMAILGGCCKEDDDVEVAEDKPIVDEEPEEETVTEEVFKLTSIITVNSYDLNEDGIESNNVLAEVSCLEDYTITIKSDNSGVAYRPKILAIANIVEEEKFITECYDTENVEGAEVSSNFTWSKNGDAVSFEIDGVNYSGMLLVTELKVTLPEGFVYQKYEGDDAGEVIFEEAVFTYTKQ